MLGKAKETKLLKNNTTVFEIVWQQSNHSHGLSGFFVVDVGLRAHTRIYGYIVLTSIHSHAFFDKKTLVL